MFVFCLIPLVFLPSEDVLARVGRVVNGLRLAFCPLSVFEIAQFLVEQVEIDNSDAEERRGRGGDFSFFLLPPLIHFPTSLRVAASPYHTILTGSKASIKYRSLSTLPP